ncbi:hypothetical protein STENM327S_02396 [Streptomyces tendae]
MTEKALSSREVFWGIDRHTVVPDGDHPHDVAVFDKAQHLHSLGTLQGPLLELPKVLESLAGEAVEAQLAQVLRPVAPGVRDGLAREDGASLRAVTTTLTTLWSRTAPTSTNSV